MREDLEITSLVHLAWQGARTPLKPEVLDEVCRTGGKLWSCQQLKFCRNEQDGDVEDSCAHMVKASCVGNCGWRESGKCRDQVCAQDNSQPIMGGFPSASPGVYCIVSSTFLSTFLAGGVACSK